MAVAHPTHIASFLTCQRTRQLPKLLAREIWIDGIGTTGQTLRALRIGPFLLCFVYLQSVSNLAPFLFLLPVFPPPSKKKKGLSIMPIKIACETFNEITLNFGKANENISIREPVVVRLVGHVLFIRAVRRGYTAWTFEDLPADESTGCFNNWFSLIPDGAVGILANPTLPERIFKIFQITLLWY